MLKNKNRKKNKTNTKNSLNYTTERFEQCPK